jgi:polysaccharide biosynthesis protein VpsM
VNHVPAAERLLAITSLAILAVLPRAAALVPAGDGGALMLNLGSVVTYDTNIFANANEQSDWSLAVVPELQYLRQAGVLQMDARLGFEIIRFDDFTSQNTEDFFSLLNFSYPNRPDGNRSRGEFELGWREFSGTNEALGARTQAEVFSASGTARHAVSDKLGLRAGLRYREDSYKTANVSDVSVWSLAADALHTYSDNLDLFLGYRFRDTDTTGRQNRAALGVRDHLLQVGAEGQLTPRITGRASVGVQERRFNGGALTRSVRPYGSVEVSWSPAARTRYTLAADKDFDTTPDDRSVSGSDFTLLLDQGITNRLSFSPALYYLRTRYRSATEDRNDEQFGLSLGLAYQTAPNSTLNARYTYLTRDSSNPFFEYDRQLLTFSADFSF